jgi:hypothetical protein
MTPTVTIKKSPVPIIWIDTSIIINITKHRLGNKLDEIQLRRTRFLYDAIKRGTRAGKLICPLAEQDEEIWGERKACLDTIEELSMGIKTDSILSIKEKLFCTFAEAYLLNSEEVFLDYSLIFDKDPVEELKNILSEQHFVSMRDPLSGGAEKVKINKKNLLKELNEVRENNVRNKVSFNRQKELEFLSEYNFMEKTIAALEKQDKIELDKQNVFWAFYNAMEVIALWGCVVSRCSDKSRSILSYYKSDYYRQNPIEKISVEFFSKLMIDKQPIRSGDIKDVEHISSMLPFVDIFITDKQRKTQLQQLSYDKEYQAKICYIGDEDEIGEFSESL